MATAKHSRVDLERQLALTGSLFDFVEMAWHVVEPRPFEENWHHREECAHLEAVSRGEVRFLVINQPPNTSKSVLVSVLWPVWDQLRNPTLRVAGISYDKGLSLRDAGKSLKLIQSDWFRARWGDRLSVVGSKPAEGNYKFVQGGTRFATSTLGGITGRHYDRIICDDLIKPKDVTGEILTKVAGVWNETIPSRLEPKTGALVLVMQRLHELDPTGIALKESHRAWVHIRFPMEYEPAEPCRTRWGGDRRTEEGELLWASRFPPSEIELQKAQGSRYYASQYQQRPVPEGGNIFQRVWFKFWIPKGATLPTVDGQDLRELPDRFMREANSWDCAFKGGEENDFVCGQAWGHAKPDFYLLEQDMKRRGFADTLKAILAMRKRRPRAAVIVEDKANGPAVIETLRAKVPGIIAVDPEGGKEARANAVSHLPEGGNVWLPHPNLHPWVELLLRSLCTFPFAANDDDVDSLTQALLYLSRKRYGLSGFADGWKKSGGSLFG